MSLFWSEVVHLLFSMLLGWFVYKKLYQSYWVFFWVLLWGFFVDADHFIDFWIAFPFSFDLKLFFSWASFHYLNKAFLFFHSYEIVFLWLIFVKYSTSRFRYLLLAFCLGLLSHLVIDVITNEAKISWYSLVYRAMNNFDLKVVCEH